jgi:Type I phosphodiesterase / nucleotide pyrophosphatase
VASGKKLILVVIDGLTPELLERGIERGVAPGLARLVEDGAYTRGVTTFPSLTPVCLSSLATGTHPDAHRIPHLAWYHRGEERIVEYGSSFPAMRAAGARQALRDGVFEMTHAHLNPQTPTIFEAAEDAGLVSAAINFTCYRGRTRHPIRLPGIAARNRWYEAVYGPRRFFFFNLFESDETGAPLAVRSRGEGSVDAYAGYVGRWLVTRDGFDLLVFYLPDVDYASHLEGPTAPLEALGRADASVRQLMDAAGGPDELLERYAVLLCSDHGQTAVTESARLQDAYADLAILTRRGDLAEADVVVTASNRCGMVYRLDSCSLDARALAERLDGEAAADVVLFSEEGFAVARREGEELRFRPAEAGWELLGDPDVLDEARYPNGLERAWHALASPTSGEVLVSALEGSEFVDLGGRDHVGGGSHGSLVAGDSVIPLVAAGFAEPPFRDGSRIVDLAPAALRFLGVTPPATMAIPAAAPANV